MKTLYALNAYRISMRNRHGFRDRAFEVSAEKVRRCVVKDINKAKKNK